MNNDVIGEWFVKRLNECYNSFKSVDDFDISMFCMMHCYLITFTFTNNVIKFKYFTESDKARGYFEFENFNRTYNSICRRYYGQNYHRSKFQKELPFSIVTLDTGGSKYAINMPKINNLHLHTIWMFHPMVIDRVREDFNSKLFIESLYDRSDYDSIDIKPLDISPFDGTGVDRVASYVAKSVRLNTKDIVLQQDLRIYPTKAHSSSD